MSSITSAATSGLLVNQVQLSTAASNIANADTKDFKALKVTQTNNLGAVASQLTPSDTDVSIEAQLVQAQQAVDEFKANATVLKVQQQTQGKLLDILA